MGRLRGAFVDLRTTVTGIDFPNPILLASGVLNETGASMARSVRESCGGVVTKSMSAEPRYGHPNPTVIEVDGGLMNAMGLPGPGMEHFRNDELPAAFAAGAKVIGSVFGADAKMYADMSVAMEDAGVHGIELNVSCPHAKGFGSELGSDPDVLHGVVAAVKDAVKLPVWTKLTPNTDNIVRLAKAAEDAGTDGVVATNTLKAMAIEPDLGRAILGNKMGGLSGHALKPVSLRAVWDLYPQIEVPIIASGGIYSARDVLEYAMAGASAFQVGTAVMHEGWGVFRTINDGLSSWLDTNSTTLAEITGQANH
jgi:dihydroorotate dehydrogenase (NAD+) catalytic subunit